MDNTSHRSYSTGFTMAMIIAPSVTAPSMQSAQYNIDSWQVFDDSQLAVGATKNTDNLSQANDTNNYSDEPVITPTKRHECIVEIVSTREYRPTYHIDDLPLEII